jgi:molybdate transport system substrate-binding protein
MRRKSFLIVLAGGLLAAALVRLMSPQPSQETVLIAAAASLKEVLLKIEPVFKQQNPTVTLQYSFAGSGPLQQQIEQGAPVDIFFSAAPKQMDALEQKGLIVSKTRHNLLTNRLVLIVPKDSPIHLQSFQDLAKAEVKQIAMADPNSVPAGQYGKAVLDRLKIYGSLQSKLVLSNSVRSVLAAVESGNADAGLVYKTDADLSRSVQIAAVANPNLHPPILYPAAMLKRTREPAAAQAYLNFLEGNPAKAIFKESRFGVVE